MNEERQFVLPKRITELAKKSLEAEVNLLEQEYMRMLDIANPSTYDHQLIDYIFKRCNKLWGKIARKR